MRLRTIVTVAVAAIALAGVYVAVAAAAPQGDIQDGYLTVTEVHDTPAGAERTPPPEWQPNPDFENGVDKPAEDADGNVVPPDVTDLPQGG